MLPLSSLVGSFVSEMLGFLGIIVIIFLAGNFRDHFHKAIFVFLSNTIAGFLLIAVANQFLTVGLPLSAPLILSTVLFGIPGVGSLIILKLGGIALA